MPRFDVGLRRIVTLSTAIVVDAATEDDAKAIAAQRALDGELTWANPAMTSITLVCTEADLTR